MKTACRFLAVIGLILSGCIQNPPSSTNSPADPSGRPVSAAEAARCGVHVWTPVEITLTAENAMDNPYVDVDVWVELKGPGFNKKVYGFWDGGNVFRVRIVATEPGIWSWIGGSNQTDPGLNSSQGRFSACDWSDAEKQANPNRRGFLRSNGRTFEYADGTPFYMLADTLWALSTWRYPWKGNSPGPDYVLQPGMGFEKLMQYEKSQGYNTFSMIGCFPNWQDEKYPNKLYDDAGIPIRMGWRKAGTFGEETKAEGMQDEDGNAPFEMGGKSMGKQDACANWEKINPAYWKNFDRKFQYAHENGLIFQMESIRREHFCTIFKYHDWNKTVSRYLLYLRARYGCYNMIFNVCHCDSLNFNDASGKPVLSEKNLASAFQYFFDKYGPLPFGQPVAAMTGDSTLLKLGHPDWLDVHATSNQRCGESHPKVGEMYERTPHKAVVNLEPYYAGAWPGNFKPHRPLGDPVPPGSPRDDYWARAHAWGSLLNGCSAGHVYGSILFKGVAEPEPQDEKHSDVYTWNGLQKYASHRQMKHLKNFVITEAENIKDLVLASDDIHPRQSSAAVENGMSGHAYMMRSADKTLALVYFEEESIQAGISGLNPDAVYEAQWYNPRTGQTVQAGTLTASDGTVQLPPFPGGHATTKPLEDWAIKLKQVP